MVQLASAGVGVGGRRRVVGEAGTTQTLAHVPQLDAPREVTLAANLSPCNTTSRLEMH